MLADRPAADRCECNHAERARCFNRSGMLSEHGHLRGSYFIYAGWPLSIETQCSLSGLYAAGCELEHPQRARCALASTVAFSKHGSTQ